MTRRRGTAIGRVEAEYIRSQIDTGDNTRIKSALQRLCKAYRIGKYVYPDQLIGMCNTLVGTAYQSSIDEKVRRWILNAIARVANEGNGIPAVLYLLNKYGHEPQTVASGIAAVYKLCARTSPDEVLDGIDFDPQMRTLAALQHAHADAIDLRSLPVNVDTASADVLKLALIVVGLEKSPDNLLNPRHSDAEMVKALGNHHDSIVSQYTVWAITENDNLGLSDLGISIKDIENQPDNVRAWMMQLLAMEATGSVPFWDVVILGMSDPSSEVRRGLALGLRNTFVDVFESPVLDWITAETVPDVRQPLLSHIIRQTPKSADYESYALEAYKAEPRGSSLRQSMEADAAQLPVYVKFRAAEFAGDDLFGNMGVTMIDKQINVANVQGGAVVIGDGNAANSGTVNAKILSKDQIYKITSELSKLESAIHSIDLDSNIKDRALSYVSEAKDDPSPEKVTKIIDFISHLGAIAEAGTVLAPYAVALGAALGLG